MDIGKVTVDLDDINLIPSIGAPDLMQYLQVLPGFVSTGDQGGQLYIRGGTPIQNMTMFDGMILYSLFHSIGLFSVFDPEIIRSVGRVYSAAFPAEYGGRGFLLSLMLKPATGASTASPPLPTPTPFQQACCWKDLWAKASATAVE
ncbi:MAG: Plug domain-containing protein [Bacteroidia bacterium]